MSFDDCFLRIDRADLHRQAFISHWNTLLKADFFKFVTETKDDRTGIIKSILVADLKKDMPLRLGEFFYQLRAALDGAIYRAITIADNGIEPSSDNRLEFPICLKKAWFRDHEKRIAKLPDLLRLFIANIQPYNAAATAGTPHFFMNKALETLHECARKDRHKKFHVVGGLANDHSTTISIRSPGKITYCREIAGNMLAGDCVILEFGMEGYVPGTEIYTQGEFTVDITIEELPGLNGRELDVKLIEIARATKLAIRTVQKLMGY